MTVDPLHEASPPGAVWTTTNFAEALPDVPTPLTWSIWQPGMEHAARAGWRALGVIGRQEDVAPVTGIFFGHVAGNAQVMASAVARLPGMDPQAFAEQIFGVPRGTLDVRATRNRWPAIAVRAPRAVLTAGKALAVARADALQWWRHGVATGLDERFALSRLFDGAYRFADVMAAHTISSQLAQGVYDAVEKLAGPELAGRLCTGGDLEETQVATDVWALAHERLSLDAFLRRHGYHGPNEGELASASWREDPAPLLTATTAYAGSASSDDPAARVAQQRADRAAAEAELRRTLGPVGRGRARLLVPLARRLVPRREVGKAAFLMVVDGMRHAARHAGRALHERGVLDAPSDVTAFTLEELLDGLDRSTARTVAVTRTRQREQYRTITLPRLWTGDPVPVTTVDTQSGDPVRGVGASAGVFTGTARVVVDAADCREPIGPGEVLVTRTTDPSWVAMFLAAGALVVDVGGAMSHGAIVARDLGIPCVIGTGDGTVRIPDGARVRVDGGAGMVELVGAIATADGPSGTRA